jgi:hypothetical protein
MLGAIRPDSWNWLLFFHLLFAFALVGGVIAVVISSLAAGVRSRAEHVPLLRAIAFRTNLVVVLPAFVLVHVFGQLLADREYKDNEPDWLSLGFGLTDAALIVGGVVLTLLQYWVLRRVRGGNTGGWPAQTATFLPPLVLATLVAVIVLMAGKPVG